MVNEDYEPKSEVVILDKGHGEPIYKEPAEGETQPVIPEPDAREHSWELGRRIRKEKGWTQGRLAKACGLSKSYISQIEEGVKRPRVKTLVIIAAALGVGARDLLDQ